MTYQEPMRVLLDVDGVLADFMGALLKQAAPRLKPSDIKTWDFMGFLTKDEKIAVAQTMSDNRFWGYLPKIYDAVSCARALDNSPVELVFVSDPYWKCDGWHDYRRGWLQELLDNDNVNFIGARDKYMIEADVLVDDKPLNVLQYKATHPHTAEVFLFDQPWNRGCAIEIPRIKQWDEAAVERIMNVGKKR